MIGSNLEIFFSCSFDPAEKEVNELVRSVCAGMGLRCLNLSAGFSAVPPDQAKDFISNAAGLIAVATKRDRLDGGDYIMPSAVREEISIAFGIGKPILIIGEDGVRYDGFMNNYGTRLTFSRDRLTSAEFIERLVYSVCKFREEIASAEVSLPQYAVEYFSESTRNLIALDYDGKDYWWTNSTTKHLKFEAPLQRGIPSNVWPSVPMRIDPEAAPAEWDVKIESSSRPFEVQTEANIVAPDRVRLHIHFRPTPQPGDYIEYTRFFRSRHLHPLFDEDIPKGSPQIKIEGRDYVVNEGIVLVEWTKKLHVHYAFPAGYGLRPEDLAVFVASHSVDIDYLATWELKRVAAAIESFGSKVIADLRVEEPQPRHMYGIAWAPPRRPVADRPGEPEA